MESPSSARRVTRSQTLAGHANSDNSINSIPISRKIEDSEKGVSKSRQRSVKQQQDRSALIDITNDSPIVGLAMSSLGTPSSSIAKQRSSRAKNSTPGSGEALLRGQVKTLLQRVEEEAELSKISQESRPFLHVQGFVNSPTGLLAPTPANTPHVSNLSGNNTSTGSASAVPSAVVEEQLISQVVSYILFDGKKQESLESEKTLITRSLLQDFSEKSEGSDSSECSSGMSFQAGAEGSNDKEKSSAEDDDASVWSMQVNASTHDEDEEEAIEEGEEEYYDEEEDGIEEEEEEDDGGLVDELCEGISKIFVNETRMAPKFAGKHTRFMYNSDDELVGAEESAKSQDSTGFSPTILRLKGLPTPKGKHLRFPVQEEEEGEN